MRTNADAGKHTLGLTHSTFTKLHSPYLPGAEPAYGMGWMLTERPWAKGSRDGDSGHVLTHGGSNNMWFCVAWLAPERDLAILVMCNRGGVGGKACDEAAGKLIELYIQSLQTK